MTGSRSHKRHPPGLSGDQLRAFLRTQELLDRRLARDGFTDVEGGTDSNAHHTSTLPRPEVDSGPSGPAGHVIHLIKNGHPVPRSRQLIQTIAVPGKQRRGGHLSVEALNGSLYRSQREFGAAEGQVVGLTASPTFEFWTAVAQAANSLPTTYPRRAFILSVAQTGDLVGCARRHRLTHARARWAFKRFLDGIGLGGSPAARSVKGSP